MVDHFGKKSEVFAGGPCDGDVIQVYISHNRNEIFRSSMSGDNTVYSHNGIHFHRYYRFLDHWRWAGLDSFDTLYDLDTSINQV